MNIEKNDIQRIGIVTSRWNKSITDRLDSEALKKLTELGFSEDQLIKLSVAGAFEIPLAVQCLFQAGCEGVIALGCVIRGETTHYDYVCNAVERGCSELQLKFNKPVAFGVLTTENQDQALARSGGAKENKGADVAEVLVEMINLQKRLKAKYL